MPTRVIAREDELALVEAFLDRPAEGTRALVLEGEPGIGKSTLWLAGVAAARERALQVLISRPAETEQTLANLVLSDLFADAEPETLAARVEDADHAEIGLHPQRIWPIGVDLWRA